MSIMETKTSALSRVIESGLPILVVRQSFHLTADDFTSMARHCYQKYAQHMRYITFTSPATSATPIANIDTNDFGHPAIMLPLAVNIAGWPNDFKRGHAQRDYFRFHYARPYFKHLKPSQSRCRKLISRLSMYLLKPQHRSIANSLFYANILTSQIHSNYIIQVEENRKTPHSFEHHARAINYLRPVRFRRQPAWRHIATMIFHASIIDILLLSARIWLYPVGASATPVEEVAASARQLNKGRLFISR